MPSTYLGDPDDLLEQAAELVRQRGAASESDRASAVALVAEATLAINEQLQRLSAGIGEQVKKWVERLVEILRDIASAFDDVESYSLAVGHTSVSVTVTWKATT